MFGFVRTLSSSTRPSRSFGATSDAEGEDIELQPQAQAAGSWDEIVDRVKFSYQLESPKESSLQIVRSITNPLECLVLSKVELAFHRYVILGATKAEHGHLMWLSDSLPEFAPRERRGYTKSVCDEIAIAHRARIEILEKLNKIPMQSIFGSQEIESQALGDLQLSDKGSQEEFIDISEEEALVLDESAKLEIHLRSFYRDSFRVIPEDVLKLFEAKLLIDYATYSGDPVDDQGPVEPSVDSQRDVFHSCIVQDAVEGFLKDCDIFDPSMELSITEKLSTLENFGYSEAHAFSHLCNLFLNIKMLEKLIALNLFPSTQAEDFSICLKKSLSKLFLSSKISSFNRFQIPLKLQESTSLNPKDVKLLTRNLFILEKIFLPQIKIELQVLLDFWKHLKASESLNRDFKFFATECELQKHKIQEKHDLAEILVRSLRNKLCPNSTESGGFLGGFFGSSDSKVQEFWRPSSSQNQVFKGL